MASLIPKTAHRYPRWPPTAGKLLNIALKNPLMAHKMPKMAL